MTREILGIMKSICFEIEKKKIIQLYHYQQQINNGNCIYNRNNVIDTPKHHTVLNNKKNRPFA